MVCLPSHCGQIGSSRTPKKAFRRRGSLDAGRRCCAVGAWERFEKFASVLASAYNHFEGRNAASPTYRTSRSTLPPRTPRGVVSAPPHPGKSDRLRRVRNHRSVPICGFLHISALPNATTRIIGRSRPSVGPHAMEVRVRHPFFRKKGPTEGWC